MVGGGDDHLDWNTEDELEIDNFNLSSTGSTVSLRESYVDSQEATSSGSKILDHFVGMGFPPERVARAVELHGEEEADLILQTLLQDSANAAASSSKSKVIDHFIQMGFSAESVVKAIQENGEEDTDKILETLLNYPILETPEAQQSVDSDHFFSEMDESLFEGFSDFGSFSEIEDGLDPDSGNESKLLCLKKMGYRKEEASIAIERCGPDSTIAVLTDFICAAQMAKAADALLPPEEKTKRKKLCDVYPKHKKRRNMDFNQDRLLNKDDAIHLPNPMVGFGLPTDPEIVTHRKIPEAAKGPPFFYYENVALAPKGVWQTISRFLYDAEPEFVDSLYFCAAARKRGYVHNLPIQNRFPLLPLPPATIQEAFPLTRRWWPSWDSRKKLNCLQTCIGSAKLTERIRKRLEKCNDDVPQDVLNYVMYHCRRWNLVWVGRNKAAVLEPDEVEMLLGFPKNHTRGGGISRTDRYKSLGNSFQVDTVAYHLSVLKELYPGGINVLSLFSGIGGAEVALHRLGIRMKNVVSVEISAVNRNILKGWWEQTNQHQQGNLIEIEDVQELTAHRLEELMTSLGGFDLVIGGSPCNNLTGANRLHRDGLEGKESQLFFDYCRILDLVKNLTPPGN